jgi:hypothetical protein
MGTGKMTWQPLERELTAILREDGLVVQVNNQSGDVLIVEGDLVLFNITDLAKELSRRGIGQGTPI